MYELQDSTGRIIVVLPMRMKHYGRLICVFVDGHCVAEFSTFGAAVKYARILVESRHSNPPDSAV
jgi:prepilin-type processing-associated H-X9-DG protein